MKTMIFEATWHAQLSLSSCPFWLSLWRARERARASPFSSRFVQMQSSDMLASAAERPGAPTPSAAAADAAKGRQNHGNDDDDDDRTIASALSGRFVLSAEEASCFFFRGGFDAPERVQMDLVCNASERDTKGYSGGRGPIRKRKKQNQNKKTSSLSTSSSSSSSSKTLQASSLASALRLPSVAALLPKLVASASGAARVPTSRYRVGAAALGTSGRVFVGANLELPRAPLAGSVHAEQFVVALAAQRGERGLRRIAVSAPPCGHCRQFCCELNCADELEFVFGEDGKEDWAEEAEREEGGERRRGDEKANGASSLSSLPPPPPSSSSSVATLRALLPRHFGPHDLARASGTRPKLLLDDSGVSLELTPRSLAAVAAAAAAEAASTAGEAEAEAEVRRRRQGKEEERGAFPASVLAAAAEAALCAARSSHTPHTRCPAGLALVWRRRRGRRRDEEEEEEEEEEEPISATAATSTATATEEKKKNSSSSSSSSSPLRVSAGGAIESAAYNPSLPPLQAALVAAVADGMPPYDGRRVPFSSKSASAAAAAAAAAAAPPASPPPRRRRSAAVEVLGAVLVERPRARVSHAAATRAALAALSSDDGASAAPPPLVVLHARGPARAPGAAEGESGYESGSEEEEEESDEEEGGL